MPERWLDINEAAARLGVSQDDVVRLIDSGELLCVRAADGTIRIPRPAFEFYVSGKQPPHRRIVRTRVAELSRLGVGERLDGGERRVSDG